MGAVGTVSSLRFVGRATELHRLEELLAGAAAGSAATLVVGGEAGVGKTRLLREFLAGRAATVTVLCGVGGASLPPSSCPSPQARSPS